MWNKRNSIIWCHSYEGVRQCGPKDHLGGVFLVPPSEIWQASRHLPSSWERSWDGGMSSRQSCSQEKSSAGFEQDEEVTNILLLIPNSQLKQGMSVLSWMITRSPSLNNNSQPVAESNGGLQVFFAHWENKSSSWPSLSSPLSTIAVIFYQSPIRWSPSSAHPYKISTTYDLIRWLVLDATPWRERLTRGSWSCLQTCCRARRAGIWCTI